MTSKSILKDQPGKKSILINSMLSGSNIREVNSLWNEHEHAAENSK